MSAQWSGATENLMSHGLFGVTGILLPRRYLHRRLIRLISLTCHCTGAAMSPAGATVLGDVLVACCTDIVDAIYIPPVPGLRQLSKVQEFGRKSSSSGVESGHSANTPSTWKGVYTWYINARTRAVFRLNYARLNFPGKHYFMHKIRSPHFQQQTLTPTLSFSDLNQ